MGQTTTVYVPLSTDINIKGFANASSQQQIVITPESGPSIIFEDTGANEALIGQEVLTTSDTSISPVGYQIDVNVNYSTDGGTTWQPYQIYQDMLSVESYNFKVVVTDNSNLESGGNSIVTFSWTTPPSLQNTVASLQATATSVRATTGRFMSTNPGRRG